MRNVSCGSCYNSGIPLNTTLTIEGVVYCEKCLKEKFPNDEALNGRTVIKEFDPTVCSSCQKDNGEMPYQRHGEYPLCNPCYESLNERIFPKWVKAFFAGVIALVVFSFIWNLRFIKAYFGLKDATAAMETGPPARIATMFENVSRSVPEVPEFFMLASYYSGINLLIEEKSGEEALEALRKCKDLPAAYKVDTYITQAEINIAFRNKDYPAFLSAAKKYMMNDKSASSVTQVASAYSCLYAETKIDSLKERSYYWLNEARGMEEPSDDLAFYSNLIEYRLHTGHNVTREEFSKQFPNGWTPN